MNQDNQQHKTGEWLELAEFKQQFRQFVTDIQIYLAAISDRLGIDIGPAVAEKMKLNAEKYPADLARGTSLKYSKLRQP
ncbi:MazG-like family protein [Wenzhouxiangella sp. EGI_FJ10305]|uniref:MazG-like family protein n=1 Tax=Wenzhouxiangella sp. EGI_FJ10305 TaxID=3243768 RepID=UPI0035DD9C82